MRKHQMNKKHMLSPPLGKESQKLHISSKIELKFSKFNQKITSQAHGPTQEHPHAKKPPKHL